MHAERLLTQTVTIHHVTQTGALDGMGDPTTAETTSTFLGWAWQRQRDDQTDNTDVQTQEWGLVLERGAAGLIDGGDRVTVDSVAYELDGPPWFARNPRTSLIEFVEASMRRSV